jgi:hypothetical protein
MMTKMMAGGFWIPVIIEEVENRLFLNFSYNKDLLAEIKDFEGAKWHGFEDPPIKSWSIPKTVRNQFQLDYLMGKNPYARYDKEVEKFDIPKRKHISGKEIDPYYHQKEMVWHGLGTHYCVLSCEMGTGKSLAVIIIAELSKLKNWWWVAPKSGLVAVQLQCKEWNSKVNFEFMTYERLKKVLENWPEGKAPPEGVIFDESSRCKNPTAQRSQAAYHLANAIRERYGENGFVIEMTGSPAPKNPADWWFQCEIACPGFLKEGTYQKFQRKLAVTTEEESLAGGRYSRIVTWKDSEKKCAVCGQLEDHADHLIMAHNFVPCVNEVHRLYNRLKGLVLVKFKKDCLDLPEKQYKKIYCKPTMGCLNAARILTKTSRSAIVANMQLRELSDGFQYTEKRVGKEACQVCQGSGTYFFEGEAHVCQGCNGEKEVDKFERTIQEVACPKDNALIDIMEDHEDIGRLVVYAGFTGSIDRIVEIAIKQQWDYIRVDGRGWKSSLPYIKDMEMVNEFQNGQSDRILFIGHPGSAGMGLTLTASPTIVYYSNDFNAESRIQSEDRIHRPGMDINRGATIIDLIHLPTDEKVLENLKKKRDLQAMSLGELQSALMETVTER